MAARGPSVRPLALSVFAFLNVLLGWLWWRVVQVERHGVPDLCSYFPLLSLLLTPPGGVSGQTAESGVTEMEAPILGGACALSSSALWQQQQWKWRIEQRSAVSGSCPFVSNSTGELLQWTTQLHVIPLCTDAEPAAQRVYMYFADLGEIGRNSISRSEHCTALPVVSVLAAAGQEPASMSGSANGLLTVRVFPALRNTGSCTGGVYGALSMENEREIKGLSTLKLFVSSPQSEEEALRLHIGAESSILLVVPRSGNLARDILAQRTAAEAVGQALGRWVLSPASIQSEAVGGLRVRFWLLGDGDVSASGDSRSLLKEGVAREHSRKRTSLTLNWDTAAILRSHLRLFLEALSTLVDLSFTSQVVQHSGLQEVDWSRLIRLASENARFTGKRSRMDEAILEEAHRRLSNLKEEWESDQVQHSSSEVVNLSLYTPSTRTVPQGSVLVFPHWGFLTFGAPVSSSDEGESDAAAAASPIRVGSEEAAAVSGAWIAQLRSVMGLQPGSVLPNQAASALCTAVKQNAICGRECAKQRCLWNVEGTTSVRSKQGVYEFPASDFSGLLKDFSMMPTKALLLARNGSNAPKIAVYIHPSGRGLAEWELAGLAADMHFSMTTQAAQNILTLYDILSKHKDLRVPEHIGQAVQVRSKRFLIVRSGMRLGTLASIYLILQRHFPSDVVLKSRLHGNSGYRSWHACFELLQHVLQQLQCSVEAVQQRQCAALPPAAAELLLQQGGDIKACSSRDAGECAGSSRGTSREDKTAMYRQLALLLARSALRDSRELLADGSLEPAPFFSLHFNLAIHVPLLLPFILPTVVSTIKVAKSTFR